MRLEDWDISVCGLNCLKCEKYQSNECGKCRSRLNSHNSPNCKFLPCALLDILLLLVLSKDIFIIN